MSLSPNAQAKKMRVYRAPSSPIAYFFWRIKMWFEATFALSMLERWEKVLLCTFTLFFTVLFLTGLIKYLPQHIRLVAGRTMYYIFGNEETALAPVTTAVAEMGKVEL